MIIVRVKHVKGFRKVTGLIGNEQTSLYFETRFGIHTFFLKSPIDVVVLNKENNVQIVKKSLMPSRVFFWNPKYYKVIELPEGSIKKLKLENGKKIKLLLV